jgi:predicted phosphohydrolase
MSNTPKTFITLRAKSDVNDSKIRDEKIGNVLDENIRRNYTFEMNPKMIPDNPIILIMPRSEGDTYWRSMIESYSTLGEEVGNIVYSDSPKNSMDEKMKKSLCGMAILMDKMVRSESWSNDKLSEEDKKIFNQMIEDLKLD